MLSGIGAELRRRFGQLLVWLRRGRPAYAPISITFPPIDIPRLKRELDLDAEGAQRGARNLPPPDNATLDYVEHRITTAIESVRSIAYDLYVANMRAYGDRLRSLQVHVLLQQAVVAGEETRTVLGDALIRGRDRLFGLQTRLEELNRELNSFRSENGLSRGARMPDSHVLHWGIVALLLVIEAALNGSFLARGMELGLLQGIVTALLIAVLNVGTGLAVGWFVLRQRNHRKPAHKLLAILGVTFYAGLAVGFNLLVAHYRDALGGPTPEDAGSVALRTFVAQPLHIADLVLTC